MTISLRHFSCNPGCSHSTSQHAVMSSCRDCNMCMGLYTRYRVSCILLQSQPYPSSLRWLQPQSKQMRVQHTPCPDAIRSFSNSLHLSKHQVSRRLRGQSYSSPESRYGPTSREDKLAFRVSCKAQATNTSITT